MMHDPAINYYKFYQNERRQTHKCLDEPESRHEGYRQRGHCEESIGDDKRIQQVYLRAGAGEEEKNLNRKDEAADSLIP